MWQKSTKNYILTFIVLIITGIFLLTSVDILSLFSPKLGQNVLYKFKSGDEINIYDFHRHMLNSQEAQQNTQEVVKFLMHKALLAQLLKKYNLKCSNKYISQYIQQNLFQDENSEFSQEKFNTGLKNACISQKEYFNLISNELLKQELFKNLLNQNLISSKEEINLLQRHLLQDKIIDIIEVDLLQNKEYIPNPTTEELKTFFATQSYKFVKPEKRSFMYCKVKYKNYAPSFEKYQEQILNQDRNQNTLESIALKFKGEVKKIQNISLKEIGRKNIDLDILKISQSIFNMTKTDELKIFEIEGKEEAIVVKLSEIKKQYSPTLQEAEKEVINEYKKQQAIKVNNKKLIDFLKKNKGAIEKDNGQLKILINKEFNAKIEPFKYKISQSIAFALKEFFPAAFVESIIYDVSVGELTPIFYEDHKAYFALVKEKIINSEYQEYCENSILYNQVSTNVLYELIEYLAKKENVKENTELIHYLCQHYKQQQESK